tara:strand:+ start:354 stop:1046 length:693 start_codon:yes stop_codon:yes gene_type:complete
MKIYFDGCSWTEGGELKEELRESQRFSAIVSKELGAEEYNLSQSMSSNDKILRHLVFDNDIRDYDLAIIQMTYPSRTEYYDRKKERFQNIAINITPLWKHVIKNKIWDNAPNGRLKSTLDWSHPVKKGKKIGPSWWTDEDRLFWYHYYTDVYTDHYGHVKEKMTYQLIKDHCKVNNVPLVLMTINNWNTKLKFDLELENKKYPREPQNHPDHVGHKMIAEDILSWLTTHK